MGASITTTQFVRIDSVPTFGSPVIRRVEPTFTRVDQFRVPAETRIEFPYFYLTIGTDDPVTESVLCLRTDQTLTVEREPLWTGINQAIALDAYLLPEYRSDGAEPLVIPTIVLATLTPRGVVVLTGLNGIDKALLLGNSTQFDATVDILIAGEPS